MGISLGIMNFYTLCTTVYGMPLCDGKPYRMGTTVYQK